MTTIAIDKFGTIAADGASFIGDERHRMDVKKITIRPARGERPARIFALTGDYVLTEALIDWYEAGHDPKQPPGAGVKDPDWTLIVIDAKRCVYLTSACLYETEFLLPQAFGSGANYAYGIVKDGRPARRAVEVACEINVWSGGEIQVVNIAEALGRQLKEAAE